MTWFKVDDGFWSHPKVLNLSDGAVALWVRAGSYCCQHLTDGVVSSKILRVLGDEKSAKELVDSGLWKTNKDGYKFHDWTEYQETSDVVKDRRKQARERMRKVRASRRTSPERSQDVRANNKRTTPERSQEVQSKFATPDPTRPDPTTEPKGSVVETTTAKADGGPSPKTTTKPKKNHPLPKGWEPTPETVDKIRTERPDLDLATEHENFCDYWHSITGAKARKADWDATWRVWMRRQKQNITNQPQKSKSQRYLELGERLAREMEAQEAQQAAAPRNQLEPPF